MSGSQSTLEEILSRAQKLETKNSFTIQLSIDKLLEDTPKVVSSVRKKLQEKDLTGGQTLLGQFNVSTVSSDLDKIDLNRSFVDELISFTEQITASFQNSIVESIISTHKQTDTINDEFILSIFRHNYKGTSYKLSSEHQTELTGKQAFYTKPSIYNNEGLYYIKKLCDFIEKDDTDTFQTSIISPLCDTYRLILWIQNTNNYIIGTKKFLENQMQKHITETVNSNLQIANRGGEIGFSSTLKGYINLLPNQKKISPWTYIYYCLRCGLPENAYHYVISTPEDEFESRSFDQLVINALQMRSTRTTLTTADRQNLLSYLESSRNVSIKQRSTIDSFKIISLCVLTGKPSYFYDEDIINTYEDWIWYQYQSNRSIREHPDFGKLQEVITSEGNDISNPYLGGQLLIMLGEYETAMNWFLEHYQNDDEYYDNFHICLALEVAKLIPAELFANEILDYSKGLIQANPVAALNYLLCIRDPVIRYRYTARLIVEARENYGINLLTTNEIQLISPLSQVFQQEEEQKKILNLACHIAESNDQYGKAAILYRLANNYEKVVDLTCTDLSTIIQGFPPLTGELNDMDYGDTMEWENHSIEQTLRNADILLNEIQSTVKNVSTERIEALQQLYFLAYAKQETLLKVTNWAKVADFIEKTNLFPIAINGVNSCKIHIESSLPVIKRVIPYSIEMAMKAYSELYRSSRGSGFIQNNSFINNIKQKAEALIVLAGSVNISINEDLTKNLLDLRQLFQ